MHPSSPKSLKAICFRGSTTQSFKKQLNHPTIQPSIELKFLKRKHTILPSNHPSYHLFLGFSRYGIGYDRHARWSASSRHLPNRPQVMRPTADPERWKPHRRLGRSCWLLANEAFEKNHPTSVRSLKPLRRDKCAVNLKSVRFFTHKRKASNKWSEPNLHD